MRLAGKVAIISGASNGMGLEEARLFAREGARVVLADLAEAEGQAQAEAIKADGGEALFVRTDVTVEADWSNPAMIVRSSSRMVSVWATFVVRPRPTGSRA